MMCIRLYVSAGRWDYYRVYIAFDHQDNPPGDHPELAVKRVGTRDYPEDNQGDQQQCKHGNSNKKTLITLTLLGKQIWPFILLTGIIRLVGPRHVPLRIPAVRDWLWLSHSVPHVRLRAYQKVFRRVVDTRQFYARMFAPLNKRKVPQIADLTNHNSKAYKNKLFVYGHPTDPYGWWKNI